MDSDQIRDRQSCTVPPRAISKRNMSPFHADFRFCVRGGTNEDDGTIVGLLTSRHQDQEVHDGLVPFGHSTRRSIAR